MLSSSGAPVALPRLRRVESPVARTGDRAPGSGRHPRGAHASARRGGRREETAPVRLLSLSGQVVGVLGRRGRRTRSAKYMPLPPAETCSNFTTLASSPRRIYGVARARQSWWRAGKSFPRAPAVRAASSPDAPCECVLAGGVRQASSAAWRSRHRSDVCTCSRRGPSVILSSCETCTRGTEACTDVVVERILAHESEHGRVALDSEDGRPPAKKARSKK
ncbi:unnamed protein product [Prorocentrum cordatum]|uniref:Uncharacterized protein n=1 Tax=Prorocentrum cordatum TaxID=2364126 RepID=A0ABN9XIN3_9DINO|nr:unnamed protein product [Polarella glacialis]